MDLGILDESPLAQDVYHRGELLYPPVKRSQQSNIRSKDLLVRIHGYSQTKPLRASLSSFLNFCCSSAAGEAVFFFFVIAQREAHALLYVQSIPGVFVWSVRSLPTLRTKCTCLRIIHAYLDCWDSNNQATDEIPINTADAILQASHQLKGVSGAVLIGVRQV